MQDTQPTEEKILVKSATGTVKWYSLRDHYGFIGRDDGEKDVFVHQTSISKSLIRNPKYRTLADNERVQFDIAEGRKGLEAINVTGLNGLHVQGIPVIIVQNGGRGPSQVTFAYNSGRGYRARNGPPRLNCSASRERQQRPRRRDRSGSRDRRRNGSQEQQQRNRRRRNSQLDEKPVAIEDDKEQKQKGDGSSEHQRNVSTERASGDSKMVAPETKDVKDNGIEVKEAEKAMTELKVAE